MKTQKKEMVIVIPGPHFLRGFSKTFHRIILKLYDFTHISHPVYYNYARRYAEIFHHKGKEGIWLHWNRGLSPVSKLLAVRRLRRVIRKYKNTHDIKLVGISLGGEIALEAVKKLRESDVKKIILICPVIEDTRIRFKKIDIFNLYSNHDVFARIASKVLSPVHGNFKSDNIMNIEIPNFAHDDFCKNEKISNGKYRGKRVSDVVEELLEK